MKKVVLLSFVLLFMGACTERLCVSKELKSTLLNKFTILNEPTFAHHSTILDMRCLDLTSEAREKGKKIGVCYDGPLTVGLDIEAKEAHPDYEACLALTKKAYKKCDTLPPDPESEIPSSRSTFVAKGNIIVDGELVSIKSLRVCEKCANCRKLSPEELGE